MSVALKIKDETSSGDVILENILQFPVDRISVKELIEQRVEKEVEHFHNSSDQMFWGLVQPTESERKLNGFKLKKRQRIDVEKQKAIALEAFQSNGFFLLVNDRQLTGLEEQIPITPNTSVTFLKLIPLVGG